MDIFKSVPRTQLCIPIIGDLSVSMENTSLQTKRHNLYILQNQLKIGFLCVNHVLIAGYVGLFTSGTVTDSVVDRIASVCWVAMISPIDVCTDKKKHCK